MRAAPGRVLVLVVAALMVNLPWAHQAWTDHRIAVAGQRRAAHVVATAHVGGRYLVDYRLPPRADPAGERFSARLDRAAYLRAVRTRRLPVLVVPGHPAQNRPRGEAGSGITVVIAALGDLLILAVVALLLLRRRRWRRVVVRVEGDLVTVSVGGHELTAAAPRSWAGRRTPGSAVRVPWHLEAAGDLVPGLPVSELRQEEGGAYHVRGRVVDVDRRQVVLRLDDGLVLPVRPGAFRNRADLRQYAEVTGRLVLAPPA